MTTPRTPTPAPDARLDALCEVLHATLPELDGVGVLGPDRRTLLASAGSARSDAMVAKVGVLLASIGDRGSSPEEAAIEVDAPRRLLLTLGSMRLLVRSTTPSPAASAPKDGLGRPGGVLFVYGPVTALRADAWALVDATALLAGALLRPPSGTESRGTD